MIGHMRVSLEALDGACEMLECDIEKLQNTGVVLVS